MKPSVMLSFASLLLATSAPAAVLHSPPASALFTNGVLLCFARNVSSSPRTVTVDHLDFDGDVVHGQTVVVPPGEMVNVPNNDNSQSTSCRLTFSGSSRYIQGSAVYYDVGNANVEIAIPVE
jgi:hypothetical protein